MKYRKVLVEWRDAIVHNGWENTEAAIEGHRAAPCFSMGYLIHRTKTDIVLAQTISSDGQINGRITIPVLWLVKVQTLKV